jgi:hemerythrin superfamily protein
MRTSTRLSSESSTIGTGDALDMLQRDHRRVETLFARSALVSGPEWQDTVAMIAQELSTHAELEEAVVYPALAAALGPGGPLIDRAHAEHDEIKELLARLTEATGEELSDVEDLRALQLAVQQHVAVEEGELFAAFHLTASPEALEALDREAAEARAKAPPPPRLRTMPDDLDDPNGAAR